MIFLFQEDDFFILTIFLEVLSKTTNHIVICLLLK